MYGGDMGGMGKTSVTMAEPEVEKQNKATQKSRDTKLTQEENRTFAQS